MLGKEVVKRLKNRNIKVFQLTRHKSADLVNGIEWNPAAHRVFIESDPAIFENVDAIINLAGENVGSGDPAWGPLALTGRWTDKKKSDIHNSRVDSIQTLIDTLRNVSIKPKVVMCASAVGYYGFDYKGNDVLLDESARKGQGFFIIYLFIQIYVTLCLLMYDWNVFQAFCRRFVMLLKKNLTNYKQV